MSGSLRHPRECGPSSRKHRRKYCRYLRSASCRSTRSYSGPARPNPRSRCTCRGWYGTASWRRRPILLIQGRRSSSSAPRISAGLPHKNRLSRDSAEQVARLVDGPDPFKFYRLMFRTIRVSLLKEGIDIDPVLRNAGLPCRRTGLFCHRSPGS